MVACANKKHLLDFKLMPMLLSLTDQTAATLQAKNAKTRDFYANNLVVNEKSDDENFNYVNSPHTQQSSFVVWCQILFHSISHC